MRSGFWLPFLEISYRSEDSLLKWSTELKDVKGRFHWGSGQVPVLRFHCTVGTGVIMENGKLR